MVARGARAPPLLAPPRALFTNLGEKLSEKSQTCSWRSPTGCREASFGPITCSAYRPNSRLERFSNPFRTVSEEVFSDVRLQGVLDVSGLVLR
jgi:hypothetical protein